VPLPQIIGHRGARAHAPENTLAGLAEAADQGAQWVEADIKLSRDGVPLLIHDESLERTTGGKGRVADHDFGELAKLDTLPPFLARYPRAGIEFIARHGAEPVRIPTLAQALSLVLDRGLGINLEIKPCAGRDIETAERAIAVARDIWPQHLPQPLISSFSPASLATAQRLAPHWPRSLLIDRFYAGWTRSAHRLEVAAIGPNAARLTRMRLDDLLGLHRPLMAWTVNRPAQARSLVRWGVHGLFTDHPGLMIRALRSAQLS